MRHLFHFLFCLLLSASAGMAQNLPAPMQPPRLVNDFAQMLSAPEQQSLEQKLRNYHDTTSTQIYVVTLVGTDGYALSQLSPEIFKAWGIGQKDKNNGVLLLIKPKTGNERGEVFIGTGYGMEGVLPDAICKRIIEQIIIPHFKEERTFDGIDLAVNAIIAAAAGEYKGAPQREESMKDLLLWLGIFVVLLVFFVWFMTKKGGGNNNDSGGGKAFFVPFIFPSGGSRSHGGGGFSGGSFGGGGGGFSGGGGAGGKW